MITHRIIPAAVLLTALSACGDPDHRQLANDQSTPPARAVSVTAATGDATSTAPNRPVAGAETNVNAGPPGSANAIGFSPVPSAPAPNPPPTGAPGTNGTFGSSPIGGDPTGAIPDPARPVNGDPAPPATGTGR